jgi:hypothetical protein
VVDQIVPEGVAAESIDAGEGDATQRLRHRSHQLAAFLAHGGAGIAQAQHKAKSRAARAAARRNRDGSKQAQLIAMLRRARGATIDEMAEALSWQAHTMRGAIAGALKKKLGLDVTSEKDEKRGRTYRIANAS